MEIIKRMGEAYAFLGGEGASVIERYLSGEHVICHDPLAAPTSTLFHALKTRHVEF